ncbi:hypothetical protein NXH64_04255, partial [Butyrivibrio fibrisolvens]|nr:hypothetical protein [Butyrivibrio fibrisolvens]
MGVIEGDAIAEEGYLTQAEDAISSGEMTKALADELAKNGKEILDQAKEKNDYVSDQLRKILGETQEAEKEFETQADAAGLEGFARLCEEADSDQEKIEIVTQAEAVAEDVYDDAVAERDAVVDEYSNLETQKEALDAQKADIDKKVAEMEAKIKEIQAEVDKYELLLKENGELQTQLNEAIKESEIQQETWLGILESNFEYDSDYMRSLLPGLQADYDNCMAELTRLQSLLEYEISMTSVYHQAYDDKVKEYNKKVADRDEYKIEYYAFVADLESQSEEELRIKVIESEGSVIFAEGKVSQYADYMYYEEPYRSEIEKLYNQWVATLEWAQSELDKSQKNLDDYLAKKAQRPEYDAKLNQYEDAVKKASDDVGMAQSNIDNNTASIDRLNTRIDNAQISVTEASNAISYTQAQIDSYDNYYGKYQAEVENWQKLNRNLFAAQGEAENLRSNYEMAWYALRDAKADSYVYYDMLYSFEDTYNEFMAKYTPVKEKYDVLQERVDSISRFITGAQNYKTALSNEIRAITLAYVSEAGLKETTANYEILVKILDEFEETVEPEPVHVPTDEEVMEIIEKHMWTKDPSEYSHEEVVRSLECLAALQKEQLQDQATRDFFCETYRNNREAVKE